MLMEVQQNQNLQKSLLRQLFADPKIGSYAILDGASNPALLDYLYSDEPPEFVCLYRGELEPDIAECAPYLVRLEQNSLFTQWITSQCWGLHWGIFALADCDLKTMRYHLRKLNMVYESETNKPLLFRYYDPRVLNVFLPTCDEEQLNELFGPITVFFAENMEGSDFQSFTIKNLVND
jgi:hypothetical protein